MKRDMELVRTIFRKVQDKTDLNAAPILLDGCDPALVARHVEMLFRAGYLEGFVTAEIGSPVSTVYVSDLTWEGHEFAGALLAQEPVWQRVKSTIGADNLAALPLKVVQDLATKALEAWALSKLGL